MAVSVARIWYNRIFQRHLFVTNTVSCCTLMGLGDYIQQRIINGFDSTPNNWRRTGIGTVFG